VTIQISSAATETGAFQAARGLRASRLFRVLSDDELSEVAERATVATLAKGETLWERGTPGDYCVIVTGGRLQACVPGRKGRVWLRSVQRRGGRCGLLAAFHGVRHRCTSTALDATRIVRVPSSEIQRLVRENHAFCRAVLIALAGDLRRSRRYTEGLILHSAAERLARYVRELVGEDGVGRFDATQSQIAAQIGTVREVVVRLLRGLEREGIIERKGRTIRVLRPEDLAGLAN